MNIEERFGVMQMQLEVLRDRIDSLEASSPLRANTEQPLVGPPGNQTESPPRWPDRQTLSEVMSWIENQILVLEMCGKGRTILVDKVLYDFKYIFQQLGTLDQGPVASTSLEAICQRLANQPDDPNSIDV